MGPGPGEYIDHEYALKAAISTRPKYQPGASHGGFNCSTSRFPAERELSPGPGCYVQSDQVYTLVQAVQERVALGSRKTSFGIADR